MNDAGSAQLPLASIVAHERYRELLAVQLDRSIEVLERAAELAETNSSKSLSSSARRSYPDTREARYLVG